MTTIPRIASKIEASLNPCPAAFTNSVDPDQLASSGSALFAIQYLNLHEQPGSSNLKIRSGCGILIYSAGQGLKQRISSQREQILSFKSGPYGKEANYFMFYFIINIFLMHVPHLRNDESRT